MKKIKVVIFIFMAAALAGIIFLCARAAYHDFSLRKFLRGDRDLNVLLITMDTTRWDHLGCFGSLYTRTPNIDKLGYGGVRFFQTISPAPLTLPSHTTIMTGTYPIFHGVRNNGTFRVAARNVTLAEVLRDKGYATGAVIASFVLDHTFGLVQGFDYYDDELKNPSQKMEFFFEEIPAAEVSKAGVEWLNAHQKERFFLWLHYYDPHSAYRPPEPYSKLYGPGNLYDGEIAYMDENIGKVIDTLEQLGLSGKTLIVLAADHGESLGDHGEPSHGLLMYDPTMHVPLIFHLLDRLPAGAEVHELTRLIDVMPTILDLLNIPIPQEVQGRSLLPAMFGKKRDTLDRVAFLENYLPFFNYGYSELKGLRTKDYLYIQSPEPELYFVRQDAREYRNVYQEYPDLAASLAGQMEALQKQVAGPEAYKFDQVQMDEETKDKLRALGYVWAKGETHDAAAAGSADKDPKRMLPFMTAMNSVGELIRNEEYNKALALIQDVLNQDPENRMAILKQAYVHTRMGNVNGAIASYERMIQVAPDYLAGHLRLAAMLIRAGQHERAVSEMEFVLEKDERYAQAWSDLGACYFTLKNYAKAEEVLRHGLTVNPDYPYTHYNLGSVLGETGRLAESEAEYGEAIRHKAGDPDFYLGLARVYELQGRNEEADGLRRKASGMIEEEKEKKK